MADSATEQAARSEDAARPSITDFLSDGGFVQLCETLGGLLGSSVRLIDAQGRQIEPAREGSLAWRVADRTPSAAELAAERAFAVPVRARGDVIGWVHVGRSPATEGPLAVEIEHAVALMVDIADQVCDRELELRARLRALAATQRLSALLARAESVDDVLGIALESAIELLGLSAGSIVLLPQAGGGALEALERDVEHRVSRNLSAAWLASPLPLSFDREFDRLALAGEVVAVPDLQADARVQLKDRVRDEGLRCALQAGMVFQDRPLGVIRLYGREPRAFAPDEIRVLRTIAHQAAVAIGQARLLRQQRERRQLQRQLMLAGDVQRRMLPAGPPESALFDVAASWEPSLELSGDFYDFVELDADRPPEARRIGIVVGDVVGKGVAAALLMSHVRASLRAHASQDPAPSRVLAAVNDDLCRDTMPNEFVTLWYGVACPERRELVFASAGHDPPLLVRSTGAGTDAGGPVHRIEELRTGGMLAGVLPAQVFSEGRLPLSPGDSLAVFTDGLSDARRGDEERYGRPRVAEAVLAALRERPDIAASALVHELVGGVRRFAAGARMPDDQTLVVLRVRS
ncbi:MAG: SpoIIE family protein phosphatase [Planctomycetota bacterium]